MRKRVTEEGERERERRRGWEGEGIERIESEW